jgi:hypothetical protein
MSDASSDAPADLPELVLKMQALKAEHRELLTLIGRDRGMAPETRQALLSHLMEEEDELVQQIAAAAPGASDSARATHAERPRLTVGSLRAEPADHGLRLGSLRRSASTPPETRGAR